MVCFFCPLRFQKDHPKHLETRHYYGNLLIREVNAILVRDRSPVSLFDKNTLNENISRQPDELTLELKSSKAGAGGADWLGGGELTEQSTSLKKPQIEQLNGCHFT